MKQPARLLVCWWIGLVVGCSRTPELTGSLDDLELSTPTFIASDEFRHLIYRRGPWNRSRAVHVYLEGDGLPWVTRTRIAKDPTPRIPLALRLMARDPGPSLYLGRPCYHGLAASPGCSPWLWTHGRYSEEVVTSMATALRRALGPNFDGELRLIGHSGGGVLAMLLAARLKQVRAVVTVAANLDIDAWADHHGYSRLRGSLNPAVRSPLSPLITQIHLAGGQDIRVPPHLSRPVSDRQPRASFLVFPAFDHRCCWERDWPAILATLEHLMSDE